MTLMPRFRPLHEIAAEITERWKRVKFEAIPYLEAMEQLTSVDHYHGQDSGRYIVIQFLSNAHSWYGSDARRIKAELRKMAQLH